MQGQKLEAGWKAVKVDFRFKDEYISGTEEWDEGYDIPSYEAMVHLERLTPKGKKENENRKYYKVKIGKTK